MTAPWGSDGQVESHHHAIASDTCFWGFNLNPPEVRPAQVKNRRVVKKEKKKDLFPALLAQVPLRPPLLWEGATRMCTTYVRTLLLTPLALVVLLVAYVNVKGGSPCCGQPGSAAHCGGGDKTSHPTCHPALTQTLGASMTSALMPEMLKPSASSLRLSDSKSQSQEET